MDRAAVLQQLERGDATSKSPRLGGMARADGVVIVSERYWAYAGVDGSLKEGEMPQTPRALRAIPLARGLVRLAASLSPLFRRTGVARRRERWFLAVAILAPLALVFAPEWLGLSVGVLTTVALLGWLLRGRTLYLHGAEHRAIAAAEERRLDRHVERHGAARPASRLRCGTNFAALLMPVAVFGGRFWPLPATAFTPRRRLGARAGADDGAVADRAGLAASLRASCCCLALALQRSRPVSRSSRRRASR